MFSIPRPQAAEAALPILLRQLRLAWIRSHWQSIASQAEAEGWSHSQFLYALCEQEVEQRQQARQHRLLRAAHLPWSKALADYDHGGRIEADQWQELEALSRQSEWLQRGENVLLFGPSGVGKTHLAVGIALAQIGLDQACRFYPATSLVQELQKARAEYNLPAALERLDRYPLLLIDDIGYVRRDEQESSVLFELICHRYERRSLLITANQPFTDWDEIFPSSSMTVAAVDRLVHHCHIIEISGDSHGRAQASRRSGGQQPKQP
ncbi:IS21-like element helper ATPase IstB [Cyanobium usitatum]|uniref:IS21-like element helper ATPase IstB n=1 Tax=Cyanobium usitatum TaxID=2304190 RepID=UPI002AD44DCD|nr:IS21-like element helper ATPase IstB [Cyanobium usitatum]